MQLGTGRPPSENNNPPSENSNINDKVNDGSESKAKDDASGGQSESK